MRHCRVTEQHGSIAGRGGGQNLVLGCLKADFELFCLAGPAARFGLGDSLGEADGDRFQSVELSGVDAQHWTAAGVCRRHRASRSLTETHRTLGSIHGSRPSVAAGPRPICGGFEQMSPRFEVRSAPL